MEYCVEKNRVLRKLIRIFGLLLLILFTDHGFAASETKAVIAIIIDDIGYQWQTDIHAILLPHPLTYSFIPAAPYTEKLAGIAHQQNKEIMLHLPMQSISNSHAEPQLIRLDMTMDQVGEVLWNGLAEVPYVKGINNHQGSLITQHPGHMQWLMQWLRGTGLYFVDSRTSEQSVAQKVAQDNGIPNLQRDIFLDHDPSPAAIEAQFDKLVQVAKQKGVALAIGHPYPATIKMLGRRLPKLQHQGIRLLSVSNLIQGRSR